MVTWYNLDMDIYGHGQTFVSKVAPIGISELNRNTYAEYQTTQSSDILQMDESVSLLPLILSDDIVNVVLCWGKSSYTYSQYILSIVLLADILVTFSMYAIARSETQPRHLGKHMENRLW